MASTRTKRRAKAPARRKKTRTAAKRSSAARTAKPAKKPVAAATPAVAPFAGFDRNAMQFWHELSAEMNREWFTANKARYEALWVRPMEALLAGVAAKLAAAYRPLSLQSKVMRIHRDVRFSSDKTPYKTHIGAVLMVADKRLAQGGNAALYVHVGADEEFVGVGCYFFEPDKLATWRKVVAGKQGAALATLIARLRNAGYVVGGHDDYKKVPRPYDADHPRAELLKMKGLTGGLPPIPRGLLHQPGLVDWLAEHAAAMAPLVTWLHRHVG